MGDKEEIGGGWGKADIAQRLIFCIGDAVKVAIVGLSLGQDRVNDILLLLFLFDLDLDLNVIHCWT